MLWVYASALLAALGVLLAGAHGHDGDVHDTSSELDLELGPLWGALASLRFWAFFGLAFGLSGLALTLLRTTGPLYVALLASGLGLASGSFVRFVFLKVGDPNHKVADLSAARGKVARVLVPLAPRVQGKVRLELAGRYVDVLATAREGTFERGEDVLVEDVEGDVLQVGKKPPELG